MTEELKPCPLCGSADVFFSEDIGWKDSYYVQCGNCQLDYGPDSDRESSLKHWNTRPSTPPALSDEALVERIADVVENLGYEVADSYDIARAILPIIREHLK